MILRREGNLQNLELGTGDVLSLELQSPDIQQLVDNASVMTRFMAMGGDLAYMQLCRGWSPEDKIHASMKDRRDTPVNSSFSLALDTGGDLYFDIFDDEALEAAKGCEEFDVGEVIVADPSERIKNLGITTVRLYHLSGIVQVRRDRETDLQFGARYL